MGDVMKKFALVLLATMLVASSAFAQLDPDDDGIGVYFDPCACVNCLTLDAGSYPAYLVITHPTSPVGVYGWEAKLTVEGPAYIVDMAFEGLAINVATRPDEYIVGLAEPIYNPYSFPAIVCAIMDVLITDSAAPVNFYIDGVYFHSLPTRVPAYLDGADLESIKELRQSTGGPTFPVATINGECAVAVESESWDGVKALYR
jgi:hypothetical protein